MFNRINRWFWRIKKRRSQKSRWKKL